MKQGENAGNFLPQSRLTQIYQHHSEFLSFETKTVAEYNSVLNEAILNKVARHCNIGKIQMRK